MPYYFDLVNTDKNQIDGKDLLRNRPVCQLPSSFNEDAAKFFPSDSLITAINTAIALGMPLLITGEPGTGKTQTAYFVAHKLKLNISHFQVKSDSTAKDLLYKFNAVEYFRDAQAKELKDKEHYVDYVYLGAAIKAQEPIVLLIDEIDKAPRDFPNDLLFEIDKMKFFVSETGQEIPPNGSQSEQNRPIIFITSNSERQLPSPFLRRCLYHNIEFNEILLQHILESRKDEFTNLDTEIIDWAIKQFIKLRNKPSRTPSTAEFLTWLKVLNIKPPHKDKLKENPLPYELPFHSTIYKG